MFGIGDLKQNTTAKHRGMGRTGVALSSDGFLNGANPASINSLGSTDVLMDMGISFYKAKYYSNGDDITAFDGNYDHIALGFPVTRWWGASLGLRPFSEVGYDITTTSVYEGSYEDIETRFTGSGGISQVYLNNSFQPFRGLSLGFSFSYLTGSIDQTETSYLLPAGYYDVYTTNSYYLRNIYIGFGLLYSLHLKNDMLSLGITYHPEKELFSTYSHEVFVNATEEDYYLEVESKRADRFCLPSSLEAGLAYHFSSRLKLAADYGIQHWEGNTSLINVLEMTDKSYYHFGLEWSPNPKNHWTYFQGMDFRLGGYIEKGYMLIRDNQINEYGLTLGMGIPSSDRKSRVNLSLELGKMGTTKDGLVNEYYAGLSLDFIMHSNWFVKRKYN